MRLMMRCARQRGDRQRPIGTGDVRLAVLQHDVVMRGFQEVAGDD